MKILLLKFHKFHKIIFTALAKQWSPVWKWLFSLLCLQTTQSNFYSCIPVFAQVFFIVHDRLYDCRLNLNSDMISDTKEHRTL